MDPRDADRDGRISIADADICDSRILTPEISACGLLGVEVLLPLALVAARRRRRARKRAHA